MVFEKNKKISFFYLSSGKFSIIRVSTRPNCAYRDADNGEIPRHSDDLEQAVD